MIRQLAGENISMALDSVWSHKFRSALTILGIIIGITTVVTVGSLTNGVRQGILDFFLEFGPDNVFLNRFDRDPSAPGTLKELKRKPIDPDYARLITSSIRSVEDAAVQLFITSLNSGLLTARVPGYETDNVRIAGYSANSFDIQPREMQEGRVFTSEEDQKGRKVAVLGYEVAKALFPNGGATSKTVSLGGTDYLITGVFQKAKGSFFGQNGLDTTVAIPLTAAMQKYPTEDRFIVVSKARPGQLEDATEEIRQLMRRVRKTPPASEDDFRLTTANQIAENLDKILSVIVLVSIALASLGLLVGGIGVMNIMLVSVTERTKEIGIRKAIGARKADIILQFLMEAVTLTGIGGVLGIVFATLMTLLVGLLVPSIRSGIPLGTMALGFGVAVAVGLFFGTWPAVKAARLDPVEALRYE